MIRALNRRADRPSPAALVLTLLIVLASVLPVHASDDAPEQAPRVATPTASPASPAADFLFGAPRAWIAVRGFVLVPRAGGDLFTFVSDELTVDRSDLRAAGFSADLGIVLTPTFDIVGGTDVSRHEVGSEYRRYIASNSEAITQQTRMKQTAVSAGLRFSPTGRGHRISHYAFIPRRLTPYAGGGISAVYYSFAQVGEFVDFRDQAIFNDRFVSDGWTVGPYVNAGVDVLAWKRLSITFDGRYTWLHSSLSRDFSGFDGIDLAGFRGGTGISIVF